MPGQGTATGVPMMCKMTVEMAKDGMVCKLMPLDLYRSLDITSKGFGMDPEITGKLLARRIRPFEVPITYRARSREDGKKITWRDGVQAIWILTRVRLTSGRAELGPGGQVLSGAAAHAASCRAAS